MSKLITICENTLKYFDNWKVFNQLKESPRIASHSIHGQNVLRRLTAEHLLQKRYFSWRFAILSTISRRFPKKIFRKYNITVVLIVKFRQFNRKWKMMVMFWREIDRMNMCFFLWFCYKSLVSGFSSRFCIVEHRCHQFKVHLLQIKTHRWNANNSHNNRIYLFNWFVVLMFVFFSSFNKVAALLCPTLSLSLAPLIKFKCSCSPFNYVKPKLEITSYSLFSASNSALLSLPRAHFTWRHRTPAAAAAAHVL